MTTSTDNNRLQFELLTAFAAYEKSVLGLTPKTLRNHGIYLRAHADWWSATHPERPLVEARTGDVAQFMIAEADRGRLRAHAAHSSERFAASTSG